MRCNGTGWAAVEVNMEKSIFPVVPALKLSSKLQCGKFMLLLCCSFAEYYAKQRAARAAQLFSIQMTVSGLTGRAKRGLTEIITFVH